ncbi:MAG: hypothetical protein EOO40_12455, partial [Deltaproteobacteria bacterium]
MEAAANAVVADADPIDVERAAGNGTPAQVEGARIKLANRAKKWLPSIGKYGLAAAAGAGARHFGPLAYEAAMSPGGFLRSKYTKGTNGRMI